MCECQVNERVTSFTTLAKVFPVHFDVVFVFCLVLFADMHDMSKLCYHAVPVSSLFFANAHDVGSFSNLGARQMIKRAPLLLLENLGARAPSASSAPQFLRLYHDHQRCVHCKRGVQVRPKTHRPKRNLPRSRPKFFSLT